MNHPVAAFDVSLDNLGLVDHVYAATLFLGMILCSLGVLELDIVTVREEHVGVQGLHAGSDVMREGDAPGTCKQNMASQPPPAVSEE